MQLKDLVKPIDQMTDEELMERLRTVRNNRVTSRPAAKAHAKRAANKGQQGKITKAKDLLAGSGLTREQLIALLGGDDES